MGRFVEKGFLILSDRKKEMIKYRARNIAATMLENGVLGVKGVAFVCIVGVFDVDVEELPTALVVRSGAKENVTEQMIHDIVEVIYGVFI